MLLVGYDSPIVQVLYLDKGLREHTLLQAIARVNRPYNAGKTHGLIVDYSGITKELQKALAIFDEQDIQDVLIPFEKEVKELKLRHAEAMSFFSDIENKNDNTAIIEKFEPINVRDDFEYCFKMFSKALDAVLPRKEANPYIDDHIRSLQISKIMDVREITDSTFLSEAVKLAKTEKARTALVKNKARQIITEKAHLNPAYYEKMKERLENLINEEKEERKEDADYFNSYKKILEELLEQEKEREKLGLANAFEHAIFEELLKITKSKELSKSITKKIKK